MQRINTVAIAIVVALTLALTACSTERNNTQRTTHTQRNVRYAQARDARTLYHSTTRAAKAQYDQHYDRIRDALTQHRNDSNATRNKRIEIRSTLKDLYLQARLTSQAYYDALDQLDLQCYAKLQAIQDDYDQTRSQIETQADRVYRAKLAQAKNNYDYAISQIWR